MNKRIHKKKAKQWLKGMEIQKKCNFYLQHALISMLMNKRLRKM